MTKSTLRTSLFFMSGAIALSVLFPSPVFSKTDCDNSVLENRNLNPALTSRPVRLEQFGIQLNIPANFRTLLFNNGAVEVLAPSEFKIMQCLAQGHQLPTEVLPFFRIERYSNPQNLTTPKFIRQNGLASGSPLEVRHVHNIDLVLGATQGGYDIVYGWYQLPGAQAIFQVSARNRIDLYKTIEQAQFL